jgi:hypothetical protein
MQDDLDRQLAETEEAIRTADNLARAKQAEVERMKAAGLNTKLAEGLLEAYRVALRLTRERWEALRAAKFLKRR